MIGAHAIVGASIQKATGRKWVYFIPLIIYSHGVLDASNIYHDSNPIPIAISVLFFLYLVKEHRQYWPGMLFALLPDLEWVVKYFLGIPWQHIAWWMPHGFLQKYPPYNWHGLHSVENWWGIFVEIGLMGLLLWYLMSRRNGS